MDQNRHEGVWTTVLNQRTGLLWKSYMHHTLLQKVGLNSKSLAAGCHFTSTDYLKCFINSMTLWALRKSHFSVFW